MRESNLDKKVETLTLRLHSDKLKKLREDAVKKGVSINALASQVISTYVEWDMTAPYAGWVVMPRDWVKEVFDTLDERKITDMAIRNADNAKEMLILMSGSLTLDAFYSVERHRMMKSSLFYREITENDTRKFVIQHNMSKKWSIFYKVFYERLVNSIGYMAKVDFTDNTLTLTIREK